MAAVVVGLLCAVGVVVGGPVRTFDQRQQGELNIHAQLDNIVIVVIPASNINLLDLAGKTKFSGEKPDKGGILQFFQKPHKDIDRYEIVKDDLELNPSGDLQNDIKTEMEVPVITSQQVDLNRDENKGDKNEEKEEEVVATVEEMKPEEVEKVADTPKKEAVEVSPTQEHSTIGETTKETVIKVLIPEELKDSAEKTQEESKETVPEKAQETDSKTPEHSETDSNTSSSDQPKSESTKKPASPEQEEPSSPEVGDPKQFKVEGKPSESSEKYEPTIKDLIKPVAAKEEITQTSITPKKVAVVEEPAAPTPKNTKVSEVASTSASKTSTLPVEAAAPTRKNVSPSEELADPAPKKTPAPDESSTKKSALVEGARKEKVIRYKPETKWAPGLVDLLGPAKPRELDERQRFAALCAPGVWDSELKTCIMPGETRSRNELARFLEAMRFGIALPAQ